MILLGFQPSQIGGLSDFAGPSTDMAMDQYHSIPTIFHGDEHRFTSYFDVNSTGVQGFDPSIRIWKRTLKNRHGFI